MKLIVELRNTFGNKKYYPACDKSRKLWQMMKQLTMSQDNIKVLREIGFDVVNIAPKDE